jgi:hypothetical protein
MDILRARWRTWLLLASLLVSLATPAAGANFAEPARQLARRIGDSTGPGAIALQLKNLSQLSNTEASAVENQLRSQLAARGLRLVPPDAAAAEVHVTLSQNLQGHLWVAEIRQGTERGIVMVSVPLAEPTTVEQSLPPVIIRSALLWSQTGPMLDAALLDAAVPHLAVLSSDDISLYKRTGNNWEMLGRAPLTHLRPWPRDLRGRLVVRGDRLLDAYLPGMVCSSTSVQPLAVACREADDPWPLAAGEATQSAFFSPTRNFFTGALAPGIGKQASVGPFFSAVPLPRQGYTLWAFAGVDGRLHLHDGVNELVMAPAGWGSAIAAVKSGCGTGLQVLVSGQKDRRSEDTVRAIEIADREPAMVSQPLELPGPVTEMWAATDGASATAIVRNVRSGRYEAYSLSLACSQ